MLQQILNAVVTAIKDAETAAGENVFLSRVTPANPERDLPCILVYPMAEEVDTPELGDGAAEEVTHRLAVVPVAADADSAAAVTTTLRDEIRAALKDNDLGGLVHELSHTGTEWPKGGRENLDVNACRLTYLAAFDE